MNRPKRIVILGGGVSGLTLGWSLLRRFGDAAEVTILEKAPRPGGWIRTVEHNGFLFEQGPRSCRSHGNGRATLELAESLGLQDDVISADPDSKRRFLYLSSQLTPLPNSIISLLTSPLLMPLCLALLKDWRTPGGQVADESIYSFVERRLGKQVAEQLADPMVAGIYAGDVRQLSVQSCFPALAKLEREKVSLLRGWLMGKRSKRLSSSAFVDSFSKQPIFTFKRGMQTLTDTLAERLKGSIHYNQTVSSLSPRADGIDVTTQDGGIFRGEAVFSTLSAPAIGSLIASLNEPLSTSLKAMTSASVGVVNVGYRQNVLDRKGFGYLIPSGERQLILGVVWDSCVFPQQNRHCQETRLTVMIGGTHRPDLLMKGENHCIAIALQALRDHLGIVATPDTVAFHLADQAIPQYTIGYAAKLTAIETLRSACLPRLRFLGSAFHGVSVNDCIASASAMAKGDFIL